MIDNVNKEKTEIIFLLDRSGSMSGLEESTVNGFNSFVKEQNGLEGETYITCVLFDHQYEVLWEHVDSKNVKLTHKDYFVRGSTSLLDAIGKTIISVGHRLAKTKENDRPGKVIFVITTDGQENTSVEFDYDKVKSLISHQEEKYNWEFVFLGANIDVTKEAGNLGVKSENAYSFDATKEGVKKMYSKACMAVEASRKI